MGRYCGIAHIIGFIVVNGSGNSKIFYFDHIIRFIITLTCNMFQGLKVSVRTRGCNGLTYVLDFCDYATKFDEVVEQDGTAPYYETI